MRIMKPTRHLLLALCPMVVLGFLYYSSGRLHPWGWGHKSQKDLDSFFSVGRLFHSVYDKQGFLLKLDGNLPLELMYKYGNLSEGVCKPGYAAAKMTAIYPKFTKPAPMFLDPNFRRFTKISKFFPPFGMKMQEKIIDNILTATKSFGLEDELDSLSCKKCIIMGNGAILTNKSMGARIDEYNVIARLNEAPVSGYEKDVGSRTTMRITYPEGAIQKTERYEQDSLFVLSAFKALDFKWLRSMIFKERLNIPTLGTVAITMALHNCDEVAVAGFGYDMSTPHAPLHYYEKIRMAAIKQSWTHNISKEKEFLIKLVKAGVIQDLTHGICGSGC
ncbi:CMP-N-acetylneuraminate-beta-1,4-galactoside alpha-2,3-sialyltransferase-like isoform X5 [Salmo trutta]|uniref:CMP-N-acetylneuraminate-beta-1,4-galactoside alpha-2,3-sialyltransferase-like isoform X5 n=1 Tax=Salmo trutta TaxID=8032 RepID=UPI0011322715|nr:CMP-N-acetylneuraminate-beta-1,4-galactoside alpha-2,3-sialyltransferase-like isoform X5 [Salmo trutta]